MEDKDECVEGWDSLRGIRSDLRKGMSICSLYLQLIHSIMNTSVEHPYPFCIKILYMLVICTVRFVVDDLNEKYPHPRQDVGYVVESVQWQGCH